MPTETSIETRAFNLKRFPKGRSSAVCLLFTRETGPLCIYQRGFHRKGSPLSALFDLGQELSIRLAVKNGRRYLESSSLIRSFDLSKDYTRFTLACFLFDLLSQLPEDPDVPSRAVYDDLVETLSGLEGGFASFNRVLRFEVRLLHCLGMAGDAERCSHCGRTLSGEEPAAADAYYWSFVCTGCTPSRTKACFFSPKERAVLKRFRQRLDERDLKLPRASVRRIQHHLNAVFSESFPLKSLPQLMKLIDAP